MRNLLRTPLVGLSFIIAIGLIAYPVPAALSQTPDGETPAEESICDNLSGAAFGLCNAYCEAMDCESVNPQASDTACNKVFDKFVEQTGQDPPCALEDCSTRQVCGGECTCTNGCPGTCVTGPRGDCSCGLCPISC